MTFKFKLKEKSDDDWNPMMSYMCIKVGIIIIVNLVGYKTYKII